MTLAASRSRALRLCLSLLPLSLLLLSAACEKEGEVMDVVPPGAPVAALIRVSAPDGEGLLTVTGEAGAVEGGATVRASNQTSGGTASAGAGGNGAFTLRLAGELLDAIRLRAEDAAGNLSSFTTVVAGAPFQLAAQSGGGQNGTVGETLPAPLVFALTDGEGDPVAGVAIVFELAAGTGSFDPATDTTDAGGLASTQLTLGTVADSLIVLPRGASLAIDVVEALGARALPGPPVALAWTAGNGQKDAPGETLLAALRVEAQDAYGNGVAGVAIALTADAGGSVLPAAGETDTAGGLGCAWTLGPALGAQSLTAVADGLADATAQATADDPPTISSVNPITPVDPGDLLAIDGDNFCSTPLYNDLRLGALAMEVVAASETHLGARVPAAAPPGVYSLTLSVGHQTAPESFSVEVIQPLGEVEDHPFAAGGVTVELALPETTSRWAMIPYNLDYWDPEATGYAYDADGYGVEALAFQRSRAAGESDPVLDFHRRLLSYRGEQPFVGERASRGAVALGDRESFVCLNTASGSTTIPANYTSVEATLRYTGTHTLIYVDDDTPAGNLPQADLNTLGNRFDQIDYGVDVAAFGEPSDVDTNGKVVILLSPVVNAMTTWAGGSYIGGFFNSIDLDIWTNIPGTSNHGEFFYAIVPDPDGEFSPVEHGIAATILSLQSIFAHEFQHMINTGQRYILQGNASSPDEQLWLNEGLSHLAENLCGYDTQNTARVKLYLHGGLHRAVSLTQGPADLYERGAAYLFCRYLADRWPGVDFTRSLIGGPAAGPANVAQATGESFSQLFKDWVAAIYLDDRDLDGDGDADDLGEAYRFTSHNIRTDFPYEGGTVEALSIPTLLANNPGWSSSLVPTGMEYLHVGVAAGQQPPPGGVLELELSGTNDMGVLLIRVAH